MTPDVTVVIATRDRTELLRLAVASALKQDYAGSVEVVVVFDQSEPPPGILADLDRTAQSAGPDGRSGRQRTVRLERNSRTPGLAGARNTGILAASGELVAFCDDDDTWKPEKLRVQVEAMTRIAAVACVAGIEIHYGDIVRYRVPPVERITVGDLSRSRLTGAHPSTYLVRRDLLLGAVGLVDEELPFGYGEDYDLLLRLVQHGTVAVVQRPLAVVLWHQGSFFSQRWEAMAEGIGYLVRKHPEIAADRRGLAWITGQRAFALAALGDRRAAFRAAGAVARLDPRQPRWALAALVAAGIVPPSTVMRVLNARGHGI